MLKLASLDLLILAWNLVFDFYSALCLFVAHIKNIHCLLLLGT